ncbi:MAG: Crp/Fnr family transcriptional regulator [Chloroflexi bacterium]|nr:Crp/Fnr family transcriptional regulator [Chloroflexota bacterium]
MSKLSVLPKADLLPILSRAALFRDFSPGELIEVLEAGQPRCIEESSFFFQQGDPASRLYVLTDGRVRLSQVTVDGQQVILRVIVPGQMFGAIGLTQPEALYPVSAEASEDSQALAWETGVFRRLCENRPGVSFDLMGMMTSYIQEMQDRYRELATERTEQRVARALLRLAAQLGRKVEEGVLVDMALSRQSLAEMTGTTLYTVSRLFSKWERRGVIQTGRERVVIVKPHDLVQIVEGLAE